MAKSFTGACKQFFGFKQDQTLSDFAKELQQLSPEDKQDIYEGLQKAGIECDPPGSSSQV